MFFLNLSAAEFFALFSAVSALVVALYLLSRRAQEAGRAHAAFLDAGAAAGVEPAAAPDPAAAVAAAAAAQHRAACCSASAQLRLGSPRHILARSRSAARHFVLDGGADPAGAICSMKRKRRRSSFVRSLPATDRVMVVRADAVASPSRVWRSNRAQSTKRSTIHVLAQRH